MHQAALLARFLLNNPYTLGIMAWTLVFVPIIGMHLVHKHGWEHWEPFSKKHK
jgi:hypothetical protein